LQSLFLFMLRFILGVIVCSPLYFFHFLNIVTLFIIIFSIRLFWTSTFAENTAFVQAIFLRKRVLFVIIWLPFGLRQPSNFMIVHFFISHVVINIIDKS
jgi:hypothetical protein